MTCWLSAAPVVAQDVPYGLGVYVQNNTRATIRCTVQAEEEGRTSVTLAAGGGFAWSVDELLISCPAVESGLGKLRLARGNRYLFIRGPSGQPRLVKVGRQ